jgi:CubicO group peptidase (beta-lactamase class C family)
MSSGIAYTERGLPWSDDATTYYAPDLRAAALSAQVQSAPGRAWHYNNYNPLLMAMVLERATGQPVADYMQQVLWQPMGAARDASWSLDSKESGFEKSESGVNATARDFARFGHLFASDGRALGRQVVPRWWVRRATAEDASSDPAAHYQYWWWVDTERGGRFLARGNLGQFIYISRPDDIVVVRLGSDSGIDSWPQVLRDVVDRVRAADVGR